MSVEERMTVDERYKYLRQMQRRYRRAGRRERGQLLDEMEAVTGQHRKHLIRLMGRSLQRKPRRRQRGRTYGPEVERVVGKVAQSLNYPSAERLQPNLVWLADLLAQHGEVVLTDEIRAQLKRISISTLQRMSLRLPRDMPRPRPRHPRPSRTLAKSIPMERIPWNVGEVGHLEVDLVHHCGPSPSGEYAHTLQFLDVCSGWSERVAILGRSYLVVLDAVTYLAHRIPFPVRTLHVDNGAEFLNNHFVRLVRMLFPDVRLLRSRPYHKNDNPYVEGANRNLVRDYFGYDRLDTVLQTRTLNRIYDLLWYYDNLFQPVMRMVGKETRVDAKGQRRIRKHFDRARPPLDRTMKAGVLSPDCQETLLRYRQQENPLQLREDIYAAIEALFALPNAGEERQDVRQTLFYPDPHGAQTAPSSECTLPTRWTTWVPKV